MARFFCSMAILNMLQIQNQQVYSFYAMVNVFLFLVMGFTFLFVMSYLLGSPRPEKAVLRMLDRFFRSAEFLMSRTGADASGAFRPSTGGESRSTSANCSSLPAKLAAWGKAIDRKHCPDTTPEQFQALVTSLQALVHRIEQFMDAGGSGGRSRPLPSCGTSSRPGTRASRTSSAGGRVTPRPSRSPRSSSGWRGSWSSWRTRLEEVVNRADAI